MTTVRRVFCATALIFVFVACLGLVRKTGDHEIRQPASQLLRSLTKADLPDPIENRGRRGRIWALRAPVTSGTVHIAWAEAAQLVLDAPALAAADAYSGQSPKTLAAKAAVLPMMPLLNQDGASAPQLFASLPAGNGEMLDHQGRPLRWQVHKNLLSASSLPRPKHFAMPAAPPPSPAMVAKVNKQFARELAKLAPSRNADNYRALVENFAKRYNLSPELVLAIIHSESNFTATVVSPKSAMGLMQLLPSTASDEVHRFLYGHRGNVSFAQLAQPEVNIRYGTAYLHILNNRYFSDVRDSQVREACVIASYNLGPNRFLRLYGSNNQKAVANINSMSPEEFHADLPRRLPVRETRFYVEKVKRMKRHYAGAQKDAVTN